MDERARRVEQRLQGPLLVAALLSIPAILIDEISPGEPWKTVAVFLNWTTWTAFAAEIVVMLRVVPAKGRWLRDHPLDVAIVLLTPPFLPAALQAARLFRLLRLLRLVRAAQLTRLLLSSEGVRDAGVLALFTILGGGVAFSALERGHHQPDLSAWDGIWWAVTTVTTVGYGDIAPRTTGGRIIGIIVMLVGIGFVTILTAAAAERFIAGQEAASEEREELRELLGAILRRLDAIERERS